MSRLLLLHLEHNVTGRPIKPNLDTMRGRRYWEALAPSN